MTESLHAFLAEYQSGAAACAYRFLGVHPESKDGVSGFIFRVWAPHAKAVSVAGDFNFWNTEDLPMEKLSGGIWQAWSPNPKPGQAYKYFITHWSGRGVYKADPVAFETCRDPETSSLIPDAEAYHWQDGDFLAQQAAADPLRRPINIYQLDLASWEREQSGSLYSYQALAMKLAAYLKVMGYTHAELTPVSRHGFDKDRGFLISEYYAPDPQLGTGRELKELIDILHQSGIGVILTWSPVHFLKNEHGLMDFDGTCCYEVADPLAAEPEDWPTRQFDYGKPEVKSFLISNAVYFLKEYHFDGIRVDGISQMLYLDYGRSKFTPNQFGGRENLSAIAFLQAFNKVCLAVRPGILTIADEGTAFPNITKSDYDGGLGFLFNWNMGWKSDTFSYLLTEPSQRGGVHQKLTFPMSYAFGENYILPVPGSLVLQDGLTEQMPGDYFWKFAQLRLLRGYQMTCPGKKLSFMGTEFGQFARWNPHRQLDWMLMRYDMHEKLLNFTRDLNELYLSRPQLWSNDLGWSGYHWVQPDDSHNSVIAFLRYGLDGKSPLLVVCNFSRNMLTGYRMGVPETGIYEPVLCSDDLKYGGGGYGAKLAGSELTPFGEFPQSAQFTLPPMSVTVYEKKSRRRP